MSRFRTPFGRIAAASISGPKEASTNLESPGSLLALAVWSGFMTGFAELAAIAVHMLAPGFIRESRDALWMIPAFDAFLFFWIGCLLIGIAALIRVPWHWAAAICAGLGLWLALLVFKSLHPAASAALATGVGLQLRLTLVQRASSGKRLIVGSLAWLALSVASLAALTIGWRAISNSHLVHLRSPARPGAPNVLMLILDTVRAADMSLYGYERRTTPELERFAERATTFDRAFAPAPWTLPSHASMFTGRWPFELEASWERPLDDHWFVLAEALRARGYATAAFAANVHYVTWETGLAQGFDHFDDYPVSIWTAMRSTAFGARVYPAVQPILEAALERLPTARVRLPRPEENRSAHDIVDAFLSWLDEGQSGPFFAFLNVMDAHFPYTSVDPYRNLFHSPQVGPSLPEAWVEWPERHLSPTDLYPRRDVYDGSIAYVDAQLGFLFRELDRRGITKNTIIIVAADHGNEFGEHGMVGHGVSLYRLSLQVPLLISFPGRVPEGLRVGSPVSLRNLAATIVELADPGRSPGLPGRSLARFWKRHGAAPDTIVATARKALQAPKWYPVGRGDLYSIAFGGYRYIENVGDGGEELYDFEHDVLERWNLVGTPEGERLLPRYRAALAALGIGAPQHQFASSDLVESGTRWRATRAVHQHRLAPH